MQQGAREGFEPKNWYIILSLQFPWQPKSNIIYLFYRNLTTCVLTPKDCELLQRNLILTLGWMNYNSHKLFCGPQLSLRDKACPHCSVIWERSPAGQILNNIPLKVLRYHSRRTWQSLLRETGTPLKSFQRRDLFQTLLKLLEGPKKKRPRKDTVCFQEV